MYGLVILGLLATAICVYSNVSHHYFVKKGSSIILCNWTVQIFCDNSSVIDILDVTVVYSSCNSDCSKCTDGDVGDNITGDNTTIKTHIIYQCNNRTSCNTSLPAPETQKRNITHVILSYNCTDTSITTEDNGTIVRESSWSPTFADGMSENIKGTDRNKDTSTSIGTTVSVSLSPTTLADGSSTEDPDTEIQPPSLNVVSAAVPTVLVLVAITLVTVVTIARLKQRKRNVGVNTENRSDFDTSVLHVGTSFEANHSLNVNGVQYSTMADHNGEYNTINLMPFTVTDGPIYNHVTSSIDAPQYNRTNVHQLVDSEYASCAEIDETAIVNDTYSHITSSIHTSNEINSIPGLTANVRWSEYDHIELANINDNDGDELTTDENTYSHLGTQSVNGRSLVDMEQIGDDYSHIGHVGHDTECSTSDKWEVAESRSSLSNTSRMCENVNVYLHDSKEGKCVDKNEHELNGNDIENHPLYQVKECDDSSESDHTYYILEKQQYISM